MLLIISGLLMLLSGALLFQQSDYKIEFEHLDLYRFNKEYVENPNIFTYKYNRTTPVANGTWTFTKNLGGDIQVVVQAYKFMSNEYRLFPLRFQFDFCDCMNRNEFGLGGFLTCGNFTKCPIQKGRYHICRWSPDEKRFPPHVPDGQYMVELEVVLKNVEFMVLRLHLRIYRPFI